MLALTRQVCALKLVESQVLADLSAAKMLSDSRALRIHQLELDVQRLKGSAASAQGGVVQSNSVASRGVWQGVSDLAEVRAQLVEKEQEACAVRLDLVESQQLCSRQQLELDAVEQKQAVQQLEAEAEISKAKRAVDAADQAWQREAQQQQNSVAQQLLGADARNRELTEALEQQVSHCSVPLLTPSGLCLIGFDSSCLSPLAVCQSVNRCC